ncbi:hypothetical protein FOVG_19080 [Fusarium oxysporum f. sp. pisi HDV247]|uniref:Methyltransferase n=1 Tax=Fusarium oxysporum f. sp. pisi HDV247 TaxID=1080344 RepID=W9NFE3_FUSOX|nr:hypothetical protein FOVG_19080 [Fusarium oxysporum f. sp. pisi HDV247]
MAPLSAKKPPRNILDIATGVGDWAIQMGDLFPDSTPKDVPPNVYFYVEDSSDNWMFPQKFDYIHTRNTAGCWSAFETQIAEQAFAAL